MCISTGGGEFNMPARSFQNEYLEILIMITLQKSGILTYQSISSGIIAKIAMLFVLDLTEFWRTYFGVIDNTKVSGLVPVFLPP